MGGGYFSCGSWLGDDKTASAFFEVLNHLEDTITAEERIAWETEFAEPLRDQLDELDEDDPPYMQLSQRMMDVLTPPARRYFEILRESLGNPPRDSWHELGQWKTGEGWQLMCICSRRTASVVRPTNR